MSEHCEVCMHPMVLVKSLEGALLMSCPVCGYQRVINRPLTKVQIGVSSRHLLRGGRGHAGHVKTATNQLEVAVSDKRYNNGIP